MINYNNIITDLSNNMCKIENFLSKTKENVIKYIYMQSIYIFYTKKYWKEAIIKINIKCRWYIRNGGNYEK